MTTPARIPKATAMRSLCDLGGVAGGAGDGGGSAVIGRRREGLEGLREADLHRASAWQADVQDRRCASLGVILVHQQMVSPRKPRLQEIADARQYERSALSLEGYWWSTSNPGACNVPQSFDTLRVRFTLTKLP